MSDVQYYGHSTLRLTGELIPIRDIVDWLQLGSN